MRLEGVIQKDGSVLGDDKVRYLLPLRGTDNGYPEVLIDASDVGGDNTWARQSIKPYIGMRVEFDYIKKPHGYNFKILKEKEK